MTEQYIDHHHLVFISNRPDDLPPLVAIRQPDGTAHLLTRLDIERMLREAEQWATVLRAGLAMLVDGVGDALN